MAQHAFSIYCLVSVKFSKKSKIFQEVFCKSTYMFCDGIEILVNRFSKFWLHLFKISWKYLIKLFYEWNTRILDSEGFRK